MGELLPVLAESVYQATTQHQQDEIDVLSARHDPVIRERTTVCSRRVLCCASLPSAMSAYSRFELKAAFQQACS